MEGSTGSAPAPNSSPDAQQAQKRSRGKYASRACVECRQRKLKCTGEEPCQRCVRRNHHCIFSDDRAVAEIIRRSRQQQLIANSVSLDSRVERLEMAMQAVNERLDSEEAAKSNCEEHSVERPGFQGESAFQSPIETFNASLAQLGFSTQQNGANGNSASPTSTKDSHRPSDATLASLRRENSHSGSEIRIGSRSLPFPSPTEYRGYLDFFFDDINACHPCVNEFDFRARSEKMVMRPHLDRRESDFLALHYIMFACADVLLDFSRPDETRLSPGWKWYQAADDLVGRTKFNGQGDLCLIQFLIFEAFYLTHEDKPNAAYNISGLACRLCFQFGLHRQSHWEESGDSYYSEMKRRIFWTTYFVDRRIALSCGRPHGISDRDIEVDPPRWISDKELRPDAPLPPVNEQDSYMMYLSCMVTFAKFSGEIWDGMFSAGASMAPTSAETIAILDAKIKHWAENVLPTIPLLPPRGQPVKRHLRQHILVHTRVSHLRLLLRRRLMVSLTYGAQDGRLCGDLAIEIVTLITQHSDEAGHPSSFRFHMAVSLGGALLILSTLLCRPLTELGLQELYPHYAEAFRQALSLLKELSAGLFAARRVLSDLRDIVNVVTGIIEQPMTAQQQHFVQMPQNIDNLFPYGAVDFAQQSGSGYPYETNQNGGPRHHSVPNNHYDPEWQGWNASEMVIQHAHEGYGVPWI